MSSNQEAESPRARSNSIAHSFVKDMGVAYRKQSEENDSIFDFLTNGSATNASGDAVSKQAIEQYWDNYNLEGFHLGDVVKTSEGRNN